MFSMKESKIVCSHDHQITVTQSITVMFLCLNNGCSGISAPLYDGICRTLVFALACVHVSMCNYSDRYNLPWYY